MTKIQRDRYIRQFKPLGVEPNVDRKPFWDEVLDYIRRQDLMDLKKGKSRPWDRLESAFRTLNVTVPTENWRTINGYTMLSRKGKFSCSACGKKSVTMPRLTGVPSAIINRNVK